MQRRISRTEPPGGVREFAAAAPSTIQRPVLELPGRILVGLERITNPDNLRSYRAAMRP
jgi:hypothetical protein